MSCSIGTVWRRPELTPDATFTQRLRRLAQPIWEAQFQHPFVLAIGDGSLSRERFRCWLEQDYLFLTEYCRFFGLAAARCPDLATLGRFADLLHSTVHTEMELHREYARGFGVSSDALEVGEMAAVTRAYTDFLVRVAATGQFAELCSALLPCMWAYQEIGSHLALGARSANPYRQWIDAYADPGFGDLAQWCVSLVDAQAADLAGSALRAMEKAFLTSSHYELMFWEMCWRMDRGTI